MSVSRRRSAFAGAAIAAVIVVIAAGLYMIGAPGDERARRLDQRRVADLQRLQRATDLYWTRQGKLPPSLDVALLEDGIAEPIVDPEARIPYGYRVAAADVYELCATFNDRSPGDGGFWSHTAGQRCFAVTPKRVVP